MELKRIVLIVMASALVATWSYGQAFNMTLLSQRDDYSGSYSDIWGYTAPNGDEYAIIGSQNGTVFYNISDPANPVEVGYIPGPSSIWRDIKVNGDHAFIVTEGAGGGLQSVSMADPENPVLVNTWIDNFDTAHNLAIDTTRSLAYVCGTSKGMHVIDISDPLQPVQTKIWRAVTHYYIHDLMVDDDTLWAGAIYDGAMHAIASPNPTTLTEAFSWTYAGAASHAGWWHPDHRYFISSDETSNGHIRIWDVSDRQNVTEVSSYQVGSGTSVHNVYVKGQFAFISYYTEGTRVLDISDPYNPLEVAYYDMHAGGGLYAGNWGVFPYFNSGTIISSDMAQGLFVLSMNSNTGIGGGATAVTAPTALLRQNVPNPFNPTTVISIDGGGAGVHTLDVFDVNGRLVRTLFRGEMDGGNRKITWDGTDNSGQPTGSGAYFYRLSGPNTDDRKKMVLIR